MGRFGRDRRPMTPGCARNRPPRRLPSEIATGGGRRAARPLSLTRPARPSPSLRRAVPGY